MAHNEIQIGASPERVFAVLSEPRSFARWVVGSREIRRADPGWPKVGTAFDHRVGIRPFTLADSSEVVQCDAPSLLKLLVKARPFSRAYVTLSLQPLDGGTRLSMDEFAADAGSRLFFNPLTDPLVHLRNNVSLRRLKALAEGKEPIPAGHLPPRDSQAEGHVTGSSAPAAT
jgi:Polyketide cyclase / dehydrase and lipid transport